MVERIIAITNQKGGVAKTTTTHNLGISLANRGNKVLVIDLDPQSNLTFALGIDLLTVKDTIVDLFQGMDVVKCIHGTDASDNLDVIPATLELALQENNMYSKTSRELILYRALKPILSFYDYVLLDCPPSLSLLTVNALSCATDVLIPVKTDELAYQGLQQLRDTVRDIKDLTNENLNTMGVVATFYEKRANDDNKVLNKLREKENVVAIIKRAVEVKEGVDKGKAVVETAPNGVSASAYKKLAYDIETGTI